jgi:hypothetical protein
VLFEKDELDAVKLESTRIIDLEKFVPRASLMAALKKSWRADHASALRASQQPMPRTARNPADAGRWLDMGTQLYLPAGWARQLESRLDPIERLAELGKAKGDVREILDRLVDKHGATVRDVTTAMLSIDDTLSDLLYDQERMLQHEIEDLTPV